MHNDIIDSSDDGGLLGDRHAHTNDVISSDKILCSLAPPQLRTMIDIHKVRCGCAICNTSKCFHESSNVCQRKQLKIMKDKGDNSCGRKNMN